MWHTDTLSNQETILEFRQIIGESYNDELW